ncbi:S8 family serine peptidase [Mesorhizobium sp.]|uniref:S8 family serine peptidase n=1 Tax=Mesorhizobium sp. TaxID=1871066 RepID=UPI00338FD5A2
MSRLWSLSKGLRSVKVAVLDGSVDFCHPSLVNSSVLPMEFGGSRLQRFASSKAHGTSVCSLIFSKSYGDLEGIAPDCTGLSVDIFSFDRTEGSAQCTEPLLAYAINRSLEFCVDIINISGGFDVRGCSASPLLRSALERCSKRGTLVVSSVSNSGLEITSVPACLPGVIAVGSADGSGRPSRFSSFDTRIARRGILAPGENLLCAAPNSRTAVRSGTSYAAAVVSGVAAVLLSIARVRQIAVSAIQIGNLLLNTVSTCSSSENEERQRCLGGRLNIDAALECVISGGKNGRGFG